MATLEDTIRETRAAISAVQGRKARAAVDLETAKSRLDSARAVMREEFSVNTTDDAREALASLRAELDAALAQIEALLSEAGA